MMNPLALAHASRRFLQPPRLPFAPLLRSMKWMNSGSGTTTATTATTTNTKSATEDATSRIYDAIIIGGGPTGLLLSNLLSGYSVRSHLLFDKRPTSELLRHPQAHFINVRSMEILKAELPRVYEGVLEEMPPVSEWE
eukprot:CAMPEP_0183722310 /NCGR_PEP_ID=MMETSP0737-20130205/14305_1 /TAXON_ID=385413 /ORGANISM="Thalassiosira miniscula, Strain CCMP1093" /LENGTH=137 /DNA_ID=CAMNT_0025952449 /DNA_START=46 /DNA_END=456 /DNA_ORIENTATION=+